MRNQKLLTWAEIDLNALRHNFLVLKQLAAKNFRGKGQRSQILVVVKADAYGHGMLKVARALDKAGADVFGVSNVGEGIALRKSGIKKTILLFENPLPEFAADIVGYKLTPMICSLESAQAINAAGKRARRIVNVHIKIDTGMGRFGVWYEEAVEFIKRVKELNELRVTGVATHFPSADCDAAFTLRQIKIFESTIHRLSFILPKEFYVHAANSVGLASYPQKFCNLGRPGLMLYGLYPNNALQRRVPLKQVMSIKTRIVFLKTIKPGRSVSYGRTFIARRAMNVATLPIGYSDGYFRTFSNQSQVLINGQRCAQIGRVTMDQIVVDVTKVKNVRLGQEAVILGKQGQQQITAEDLAKWAGTINYEIVCNLGNRMTRIYR